MAAAQDGGITHQKAAEDAGAQYDDEKQDLAQATGTTVTEDPGDKFRRPQHPYKNFSGTSTDSSEADTSSSSDSYLPYTDDLEMRSHRNEFCAMEEEELSDYYRRHPELSALLKDFMLLVLQQKPENVYAFAREHFSTFNAYPEEKGKPETQEPAKKP